MELLYLNSLVTYNNNMDTKLKPKKPRNLVAKDLRTPKYRMRVVRSKKEYTRISEFKILKEYDNA